MKTMMILALFILQSIYGFSQSRKINDLVGRWNIAGENNKGAYLEIVDSSTIILNYMGETRKLIDCKLDFSKSPAWFDFSAQDTSSILKIKSLLLVMGDDVLKWQIFIDDERPSHFSATKGEMFYLKKTAVPSRAIATN